MKELISDQEFGFYVYEDGKPKEDVTIQDFIECGMMHLKSQAELADAIGVSPQVLDQWKRGKTLPSDENMVKLAVFIDCNEEHALLLLNYWRAKTKSETLSAEQYRKMAGKFTELAEKIIPTFRNASSIAGAFIITAFAILSPGELQAARTLSEQPIPSSPGLYIMENTGRRLRAALRRIIARFTAYVFCPVEMARA